MASLHEAAPFPAVWNCAIRVDLHGEPAQDALRAALRAVVDRHWSLRTRLARYGNRLVQEVLPADTVRIGLEDFRRPGPATPEARAAAWCAELAGLPFRLADPGPLFRVALGRVADRHWLLVLVQHHLVTDATSMATVLAELAAAYHGQLTGEPPVSPSPRQFVEFSRWQRDHLASPAVARSVKYWRSVLADAPLRLELPAATPDSDAVPGAGIQFDRQVPDDVLGRLTDLIRTRRLTLYPVLLGAFGRLLAHLSGQTDMTLTGSFGNRAQPEFASVVGLLANTVAIRLTLAEDLTVGALLRRTQETVTGALAHESVPFPYLLQKLGLLQAAADAAFPQATCTLNREADDLRFDGLRTTVSEPDLPVTRTQFGLFATVGATGLRLRFELAADRFGRQQAEKLADQYLDLLARLPAAYDAEVRRW